MLNLHENQLLLKLTVVFIRVDLSQRLERRSYLLGLKWLIWSSDGQLSLLVVSTGMTVHFIISSNKIRNKITPVNYTHFDINIVTHMLIVGKATSLILTMMGLFKRDGHFYCWLMLFYLRWCWFDILLVIIVLFTLINDDHDYLCMTNVQNFTIILLS